MSIEYHKKVFNRFGTNDAKNIDFDVSFTVSQNIELKATEQHSNSKIGLYIDTGMTVPRESFYPIFHFFPDLNILVYDKRGHANSKGGVDTTECMKDNGYIASRWKERRKLDKLIGIGHSYGGMVMVSAATLNKTLYDAIILAGAPVQLNQVVGLMPKRFTRLILFFYNLAKMKNRYAWDEIVRHHRSLNPWVFAKNPGIVALRINSAQQFNDAVSRMENLMDMLSVLNIKPYLFYGCKDKRLGIRNEFSGSYRSLEKKCHELGIFINLLPGLSHRFNLVPEGNFAFSYNNTLLLNEIARIIDLYR